MQGVLEGTNWRNTVLGKGFKRGAMATSPLFCLLLYSDPSGPWAHFPHSVLWWPPGLDLWAWAGSWKVALDEDGFSFWKQTPHTCNYAPFELIKPLFVLLKSTWSPSQSIKSSGLGNCLQIGCVISMASRPYFCLGVNFHLNVNLLFLLGARAWPDCMHPSELNGTAVLYNAGAQELGKTKEDDVFILKRITSCYSSQPAG